MEKNAKQDSKSPGAFGYFPWSPRIAQNLITNPAHITPKTVYSSPKPLTEANQFNLSAKVQEISIDQTWFKKRDRETIVDTKEEGHVLTGKGDAAEASSFEIEEIIEKQCAKDSENKVSSVLSQLECEHVRSDTTKFGKVLELHSDAAGVNDNAKEQNEERLSRIEQLILPSEQFTEFDTKSASEKNPTPVPRSRYTDSSSSTENALGPNFVPVRDKHFVHSRSDSCTTSVCSTCSLISTVPSRSRCSSGDGCSSVECDGHHKNLCAQSEGIHKRNYTICYLHGPSYNPESLESVGDQSTLTFDTSISNRDAENIPPDVVDCSCGVERSSETRRHESRPLQSQKCLTQQNYDRDKTDAIDDLTERRHVRHTKNLLSEMQLMFYIIRLQTNKFGELKSLIEAQHMSLTQQGQSINNLVQSVMRLSVRLHQQTCSLDCLTKLLKRQEVERRRRQTVAFTTVLGFVVIYMLQQDSVKGKIAAFFRMFGITRQLQSFRRTRRMVSEIWRDIPPLLTNFWRIFIFKGRTE